MCCSVVFYFTQKKQVNWSHCCAVRSDQLDKHDLIKAQVQQYAEVKWNQEQTQNRVWSNGEALASDTFLQNRVNTYCSYGGLVTLVMTLKTKFSDLGQKWFSNHWKPLLLFIDIDKVYWSVIVLISCSFEYSVLKKRSLYVPLLVHLLWCTYFFTDWICHFNLFILIHLWSPQQAATSQQSH